jgi:hypothetical protein
MICDIWFENVNIIFGIVAFKAPKSKKRFSLNPPLGVNFL